MFLCLQRYNCRRGDGGGGKYFGKKPLRSFNYYRRMTQKQPPILRNLDKFSPGAFYLIPLQLSTKEKITFLHKCVSFRQKI